MPLPETIPVKYTEEDAECLSVRPVVRQTFRLHELLDMILSVTGKDLTRVQKVLRSGTIVFHFYRYRWEAFSSPDEEFAEEVAAALTRFPDPDPRRPFVADECTVVIVETGSQTPPEWKKKEASQRRFLRRRSFWTMLMALAEENRLLYVNYSYDRKGDLYGLILTPERKQQLSDNGSRLLPSSSRGPLASLPRAQRLLFLCPRL